MRYEYVLITSKRDGSKWTVCKCPVWDGSAGTGELWALMRVLGPENATGAKGCALWPPLKFSTAWIYAKVMPPSQPQRGVTVLP